MKKKNTILRMETDVDTETGEVVRTKHTVQYAAEPQFVKLYLDCLGVFSGNAGLDKSLNDMLLETLRYMSYADDQQRIYLNSEIKKNICKKTGKSMARYNQALTLWVKENVLTRDGRGTYRVNPFIFGKGDWRDISELRATFNFKTGEVTTEKELSHEEKESPKKEEPQEEEPQKEVKVS